MVAILPKPPAFVNICACPFYVCLHYYALSHAPVNMASIQGSGAGVGTGGTGTYGMDLLMADKTAFDQFMNGRDPKDKPYRGGQNVSIAGQGGMFYPLSTVEVNQIQDGTANTFLFGEKYANPDWVETGFRHGDCWDMYGGAGPDVLGYCANFGFSKETFGLIKKDTSGYSPEGIFGSPHPGGVNFVMADGSVRQISYAIDSEVLNNLGNRSDGNAIDITDLAR
jgi:prepilin-type processing-associated H-X9-DG protein